MSVEVATHSGPFHADDVLAWVLIKRFCAPDAHVIRTRDAARLAQADIVVDVGGTFDPSRCRFDHHQAEYVGDLSSAGMVLNWLEDSSYVAVEVAQMLRAELVDYVDAVDNGRRTPSPGVPCVSKMVESLHGLARTHEEFDEAFLAAAAMVGNLVDGLVVMHELIVRAEREVVAAMAEAAEEGRRVLYLETAVKWKPAYFNNGGADHPSDYVLLQGTDGSWRVMAIPPELGSFAQKRSLPEAWAGLTGEELEAVTGIPGSVFCHKNRFIAVFKTREGALEALESHGLMRR